MHISAMLNPENHSEETYSSPPQVYSGAQNTGTTNIPRSTLSPVTQLGSLPAAHAYSYEYDSYNSSPQACHIPSTSNRNACDNNIPPSFFPPNRNSAKDSATAGPSGSYGSTQTNSSRMTMPTPRPLGAALQDRPSQHRNIISISHGLYTHAQPQGTGSLAALATLAASRDSRGNNGQETRRWGSTDHHQWDRESTAWGHQALGEGYREAQLRRGSQPLSPRDTIGDFETLPAPLSSGSGRRTVSVGSQTSRPNTPERGRPGISPQRVLPAGICTASAFVVETASHNRSSSPSSASPMSPSSAELMPDSPSSDIVKADDDHKCSYTESCETGSPLRKVVSHFFGRNKLATRKIPKNLWVYFCRKHYQRSRYRNPRGFACLQIQLVQTQIGNLRRWGGVIDWTVKVRRREEMRSRTNPVANQSGEAGNYANGDGEVVSEPMAVRAVTRRRASGAGGSIPTHYLQYVGEHKTMEEVTALVEAIQQDMEQNGGTFPDLELLPRVAGEGASGEGEEEHNDRIKGKRARVSKPKPSQVRKRRGVNSGERATVPTSAAEYTSIALSQRSGTHQISTLSATSRSAIVPNQPVVIGTSMAYAGNSTGMRPKRKLEIRCGEIEEPIMLRSEQRSTTPVHRVMETPPSPTKRRRLSQEMANDVLSNDGHAQDQDHQTATPPASAPSASRRTSLVVDCTAATPTCLSHTILEEVDAALESVRVTSGATTSRGTA